MNKIFPLYKVSLRSYFLDPLFYISSIITVLFCAFRFFYVSKFFISGIGSTDLKPLFNSIPVISIITSPLLMFRLRNFIFDDSIPLPPFLRNLVLCLSAFTANFISAALIFVFIPLSVFLFGSVEAGQLITGLTGIVLYLLCAASLSVFSFSLCKSVSAVPVLISSLFLAVTSFIHLLPLYFNAGSFITFICHTLSFSWHFDSFSKGILDSRSIFFFLCAAFIFILLAAFFEYRRISKKADSFTCILFFWIILLLSVSVSRLYFRFDLSSSKQFSVSKTSRALIQGLNAPLKITYFRSRELKNLYPQVSDVGEFLSEYCAVSDNISLNIQNADSEKLKALGIQGQQIKSSTSSKTEYTTVYSAVLLQYGEKSSIIPFVLSTQTLEYDLSQRLQTLITEKERTVYLISGNGRKISESYMYAEPWLNTRGFRTVIIEDSLPEQLQKDDIIVLFGSGKISTETEYFLEKEINKGTKAFIMTSPFSTSIEDEWKITKAENTAFLSFLNSKGFAFNNTIAEDISCYPLTMAGGEGSNTEYVVINYPLWLSIQSQAEAKSGLTLFWASPLDLYNDAVPLLYTSKYAWLQESAEVTSGESLFLTDPFTLPKSANQAGKINAQYIVGAKSKNIVLIPDQFFLSSLMTGFISEENSVDFRNYDFFVNQLLRLRGENELAILMEKAQPVRSLYKVTGAEEFSFRKHTALFLSFVVPSAFILLFGAADTVIRLRRGREYEN